MEQRLFSHSSAPGHPPARQPGQESCSEHRQQARPHRATPNFRSVVSPAQNADHQQRHGADHGGGGQQLPAEQEAFLMVPPGAGGGRGGGGERLIHSGVPLLFQPGLLLPGRFPGGQVDDVVPGRSALGGRTAATQLISTPGIPATRYPARADRLMAMAPGVDWATAAIFSSSSSVNKCFFHTN